MSKISKLYERKGDKKNSDFFEEHIEKVYLRREKAGINQLIKGIKAIIIQVQTGDLLNYMAELYLMGSYRFHKGYLNKTHKIIILRNKENTPDIIVIEPIVETYMDKFTAINMIYPRGKEKVNARYIGEIFKVENLKKTVEILESQEVRFQASNIIKNQFLANKSFRVSDISYFTNNVIVYTESDLQNYDALELGESFDFSSEEKEKLDKVDKLQKKYQFDKLIQGLDHLATRVLSGDREYALLEFTTMTSYYYWGAYNIEEMNSSTNVMRNPNIKSELESPAKVFTANNTPFITKSIDQLPSPTEDFVRNFGKRMHHLAYAVADGELENGTKNIDYIVGKLAEKDVDFLANVIGECKDFPDLKQIFSKTSKYSRLITEYVQRCHGFEGFFTKNNVAQLTQAAGEDEALKKADVCD